MSMNERQRWEEVGLQKFELNLSFDLWHLLKNCLLSFVFCLLSFVFCLLSFVFEIMPDAVLVVCADEEADIRS